MNHLTLFAVLMLLCLSAHAQEDTSKRSVEALLGAFRTDAVLRVDFEELVKLPFLKEPLQSSGRLVVHSGDGLFLREIESPTPSVALVSGSRIVVRDGTGTMTIDESTAPEVAQALMLLDALVRGDVASLRKRYRVELRHEADERWTVTLQDASKRAIFQRCTITGRGGELERMVLEESGDVVRTMTFETPTRSEELTAAERKTVDSLKRAGH